MKQILIFSLSFLILTSVAFIFLSHKSELFDTVAEMTPQQTFSLTPLFDNQQSIFGQDYDLSRYDLHERYERELTNVCYAHNTTLQTLKRANRYFPILEPILIQENVPTDFIYLCCIESSLNTRAKSPVGAAGLWQFMAETGRQYGLIVNDEVDERYNIQKATHAACRYLKDSYKKFGDWMAVAASYNAGVAGVNNRLNAQQERRPMDILLPEETSRYMFRIMAYKALFKDPYKFGFVLRSQQLYRPIRTTQIEVTQTLPDLVAFAKQHATTFYHLKEFNPWLRGTRLTVRPGQTFYIDLPVKEDMYYYQDQPFAVHNTAWVVDK